MDCQDISRKFANYYQSEGFRPVPSSPMLQKNLPMAYQFSCTPPEPDSDNEDADKFVRNQTCFRHFDVDLVGRDNHHLSLFEMSGAFQFGQNSREEIIARIWEWATRVMGIDPARIWATYFGGGEIPLAADFQTGEYVSYMMLPEDVETFQAWRKVGVSHDRLIPLDGKHNFWLEKPHKGKKKENLRCGSTSELFYDLGENIGCKRNCLPACDCGRYVEFSNNRFVSHTLDPRNGRLNNAEEELSETVTGIERVLMILEDVDSVWDLYFIQNIVQKIDGFVRRKNQDDNFVAECEYALSDHIKALCVLIADGAPAPGRSGRARIVRTLIRKILTRMMLLEIKSENFFPIIVSTILPAASYPNSLKERIIEVIKKESEKFQRTLQKGARELSRMIHGNQEKKLSPKQLLFMQKYRGMPELLTAHLINQGL